MNDYNEQERKEHNMTVQDLASFHKTLKQNNIPFYTDIFTDDIWGDMGVDTASVSVTANEDSWHIHYIRTQSGIPYIFADYVSNIVDEYHKDLSHEQFYDYLNLHNLQKAFADFMHTNHV